MGNIVGVMSLPQRKISDEDISPTLKSKKNKTNHQNKKNDPIVMAISKALDDPNTSPLSIKNRKSFE